MIKAIANQKLDISKEEYDYYLALEKSFGKGAFVGLFKTNSNGQIIAVMPPQAGQTAMILIFFLLNVMFNQRLRKFDTWMTKLDKLEERVVKLEDKINKK